MHKINFEIMIHRINNKYCEIFTFSICVHPYFFFQKKVKLKSKIIIIIIIIIRDPFHTNYWFRQSCFRQQLLLWKIYQQIYFLFPFPCRDINKFYYINWLQAKFEHCFSFNKDLIGNWQLPQAFLQCHLCCHMEIYHSWLQRILRCS